MCKKKNIQKLPPTMLALVPLLVYQEYQTSPSVMWSSVADSLVNNTGSTLKKFGLQTLKFNERKHKGFSLF